MEKKSKRIAKNTIMLYIRMLLSTIVSLYTSRIVLNTLGVEDYGIYNIVGGVIVLFSFLNTSLTNASERYLSIAVEKADGRDTQQLFSSILIAHILVCVFILVLAETIGLWFLLHKIEIPANRMNAALIVYQLALLNTCMGVMKVPYNAAIIANEHMSFYAYTSVAENIMKLLIVYVLLWVAMDKLILYGILLLLVSFVIFFWYKIYVEHHFDNNNFQLKIHKTYFKGILSFSGWSLFGSVADIGYKQGSNIILNLFYGVTLNAALGIAETVRSTLFSFVSNLQIAANPQIIKSYSSNKIAYYDALIFRISKYSFYLMLFFAIPFVLNVNYILNVWLINPPEHTATFLILMMIFCLIDALHGPLWISVQATGKIRNYQIITSFLLLLNLPLSYLMLSLGSHPEVIIKVQIVISFLTLLFRLYYSAVNANLSIGNYLSSVLLPVLLVLIVAIPVPIYVSSLFHDDFNKLIITGLISIICILLSVLIFGMKQEERNVVFTIILKKIKAIK